MCFTSSRMAFDRLFCPIKSNKSARKAISANHHQTSRVPAAQDTIQPQSDVNNTTNHRPSHRTTTPSTDPTNGQFNNTPYRYVTQAYEANMHDELSVKPGDIVLYEFSDLESGKNWSHVISLAKNLRGFVPSEILSTEKRLSLYVKKKLPSASPVDHPHPPPTRTQCTSERTCPSNGGSIKLQHPHHLLHHPHQDLHSNNRMRPDQWMQQYPLPPNSFQGSSGCQTFHKYPDFSHPPAYYNLAGNANGTVPPPAPIHFQGFRPFLINNYGPHVNLHNFVAREEGDLNVAPGEVVTVLNKDDEDWFWVRRPDQDEGFVPARFIVPYEQVQSVLEKGNSTVTMRSSRDHRDLHTYINHRPDRESLQTDQQSSVFPNVIVPLE